MRRTQQLMTSREIIFIDSTSSCDGMHTTATLLLAATNAGAIPIAVLLHNSQTTEGYHIAFGLLKGAYPHCFGGQEAPNAFMTDNSSAEKDALRMVWPQATQLLCHFHVLQAEWRWLTSTKNGVPREDRQKLMSSFKQVHLQSGSLPQQEGVLTRGHQTNNFAEASIRILKDIVLCRTKAFNAVALAEFVAVVWEKYFQVRILKHAHNRVASHSLLYDKLLQRLPDEAAASVVQLGHNIYSVPGKAGSGRTYEVYGGSFPNAPVLTAADRHRLGELALGEECPPASFFSEFRGTEDDTDSQTDLHSTGLFEGHTLEPGTGDNTLSDDIQPCTSGHSQIAEVQNDGRATFRRELDRLIDLAAIDPMLSEKFQRTGKQLQRITTQGGAAELLFKIRAVVAGSTRRGGRIRVQPTAISRRRTGVTRGSRRIPAGRPTSELPSKRQKRLHKIGLAIQANVPPAKSHGKGH
ncbi:uncharacterized protein LOC135389412 [Ornithodoros turicata]|uniref:uncharacterized protein LOC135389412 n=1 Tax=Ornithodoros turicata TaxID=34597 RepID=UPI00313A1BB0